MAFLRSAGGCVRLARKLLCSVVVGGVSGPMEMFVLAALMLTDPFASGTIQSTVPSPATVRVEQRLCRGRIKRLYVSPYGGMSIKFMFRFAGGHRAIFKPNQTRSSARYRAEIAAYRLASHLGVDMVPPACERTLTLKALHRATAHPRFKALRRRMDQELNVSRGGYVRGAAIHFVPRVRETQLETNREWHEWFRIGATIPRAQRRRVRALADILMLDLLFHNPDRFTGGNLLEALPSRRLLMIDNGASFRNVAHLDRNYHQASLKIMQRVRRVTYRRMLRLDTETLARVVRRPLGYGGSFLSRREQRALLKRRELIRAHVEGLIQTHGRKKVFLP